MIKIKSNPSHAFESDTLTDFRCRENAAFLQKPKSMSSQYSLEDPDQSHLFKPLEKPKLIIRKVSFIDKVSNDLKKPTSIINIPGKLRALISDISNHTKLRPPSRLPIKKTLGKHKEEIKTETKFCHFP
jgi:hypothetical protein